MEEASRSGGVSVDEPSIHARKGKKTAVRGFFVLLILLLAFAVFFNLNFKTVIVSGESMMPTFRDGQRVVVSNAYWLVGPLKKKDIVVVKDTGPTGYFIKRVYRLAGETVDWANAPENHKLATGLYKVPDGTVYVLGDNRMHSEDSRKFGPVPVGEILGKVVVIP